MKKIAIFFLITILYSCGPKRLGCGPRRCEVDSKKEIPNSKPIKNPEVKTSGLV
ncbi:hypothetical protein [Flavobacterium filum]|uniref:hypothetical protein n=1 Tax=Flavobacterium TaxID=237 RepID=UPI000414093E|nr:hypothetical protein [Flavobacterium filum]